MNAARILIIDDEVQLCEFLEKVFASWNMAVKSLTNPLLAADELRENSYNVVLLDVFLPEMNGMELLVSIAELRPATKVIIMTGYADTEMAIQALRLGAFDFLEKPIAVDLLYHTVKRALDTQCLELEHKKTLEELSHRNRELLETNEALAVLVKNIERTKQETERRIILQVRSLIMPIVENLRKDKNLRIYESQLVTLANYIEDITSGLATNLQETPSLSFRELRIALMIKYGMTSEEIAGHLHITLETVKTYRRSIRKKLGLTGTKHRLTAYLEHLEGNVNAIGRQCR